MSRVISFRDLLLSEELQHIRNEIELLSKTNDILIRRILTNLGFHPQHDIEYIPSLHRDMQGIAKIGFQAVGEMSRERQYNKYLDAHDLAVVSGMKDATLGKELNNLMGKSVRYQRPAGEIKSPPSAKKAARYENIEDDEDEFPDYDEVNEDEYVEEGYAANLGQIRMLEELRDYIRSDNLGKGN